MFGQISTTYADAAGSSAVDTKHCLLVIQLHASASMLSLQRLGVSVVVVVRVVNVVDVVSVLVVVFEVVVVVVAVVVVVMVDVVVGVVHVLHMTGQLRRVSVAMATLIAVMSSQLTGVDTLHSNGSTNPLQ